jgi:multiple sugar transport system substrate-binding protein
MKRGDDYYGLPTAVRSLALFYNKKLFTEAGLDPSEAAARRWMKWSPPPRRRPSAMASGNISKRASTLDMAGQDQQWWREVLVRQFGGEPYTDNDRKVAYNSDAGKKALKFYTDLQLDKKVGQSGFMDEGQAAFKAGLAAMTIDGTFRLGAFRTIEDFEWGVTELPAGQPTASARTTPATSPMASLPAVEGEKAGRGGEVPRLHHFARGDGDLAEDGWRTACPARAALTDANLADPVYGPSSRASPTPTPPCSWTRAAQRQTAIDMVNRVCSKVNHRTTRLPRPLAAEQAMIDAAAK